MIENHNNDKGLIAKTLVYYNKNAILELSQGNYQKALELFQDSYKIEDQLALKREKAKTLVNISNTELLLGEPSKALESVEKASEIFVRLNCRQDNLQTLLLAGVLYAHLGEYKTAVSNLEEVVRSSETADLKGEAYMALHQIYLLEQNNQKAQDAVTKAIQLFERIGKTNRLKQALDKRAAFFRSQHKSNLVAQDLSRIRSLGEKMEL